MIVLDASCALKLILKQDGDALARRVVGGALHAPFLIDIEILSGLRRLARQREITGERATQGLEWFFDLGIERHHSVELPRRVFTLRNSLSAYDAAYVALAEFLAVPLLTCDGRLARSHGHHAEIEMV